MVIKDGKEAKEDLTKGKGKSADGFNCSNMFLTCCLILMYW